MTIATHALASHTSRMLRTAGKMFVRFLEAVAEARKQRALMEAERYRDHHGRWRKNDDA